MNTLKVLNNSKIAHLIILTNNDILCLEQISIVLIGDIIFRIQRLLFGRCIVVDVARFIVFVDVVVVYVIEAVEENV